MFFELLHVPARLGPRDTKHRAAGPSDHMVQLDITANRNCRLDAQRALNRELYYAGAGSMSTVVGAAKRISFAARYGRLQ